MLGGVRQSDLDAAAHEEAVEQEHVHAEVGPEARRAARALLVTGFLAGAATWWVVGAVSGARSRSRRGRGPDGC
jgi:hypothetical protein